MTKLRIPMSPPRGMALVLVLGALVLISLLAVAFFASISKELSASKSYASGVSARIYADSTANIVIGQLKAATTGDDPTKTWVSQPGLLRQYNSQGNQHQVFKLYSSDKMVEDGSFSPLGSGGAPADVPMWSASDAFENLPWNSNPGVYTDLNAPIVVNKQPKYPILNPGGLRAATKIQGFEVAAGFGLPDSKDWDEDGDTAEIGQIPMPVRWLYVLADGRLATATPDPSKPKTVQLTTSDGAAVTKENAPVARVAFWTDDDSCRLNINTASDGDFWMMPVAAAADDPLSTNQVTTREFQRYPGHPATTSLAPVFDFLTSDETDLSNFLYAVTPRISGRGSQLGTRYIGYGQPINLDDDRLYTNVDELLLLPKFNTSGDQRFTMNTANITALKADELDWRFTATSKFSMAGTPYVFSTSFGIDPERLELMRFFLTANSRSPEVNLFGKPRVSLWPVDTRPAYQSVYDRLLAFCATVNSHRYYFQRQNPLSATEDFEAIPRNQDLLGYLSALTSAPIPGSGGDFSGKYAAADRQQLMTNIFDWIRTVNIAYRDKTGAVQPYAWQKNPDADGTQKPPGLPGSGQVVPIKIGSTRGVGRFPTLSKAGLAIVREEEVADSPSAGQTTVKYRVIFLAETYVPVLGYAGLVPDYNMVVSGLAGGFEFVADTQATAASPKVLPISIQDGTIRVTAPSNFEPYFGRAWGGTQGFNHLLVYSNAAAGQLLTARQLGSGDPGSGYPFVSGQLEVTYPTADKNKIRVGLRPVGTATERTVNIRLTDPSGAVVTTNDVSFPGFGPLPGAFLADVAAGEGTTTISPNLQQRADQMAAAGRLSTGASEAAWRRNKSIIGPTDVVRGMELEHGDLRLLAMQGTNARNRFVPHRDYGNATFPQAHSLMRSSGSVEAGPKDGQTGFNGTTPIYKDIRRGYLVNGTSTVQTAGTALNFMPQAPSSWSAAPGPGDFTTGISSEGDGPHIIKADEGNSSFGGMNWGMSTMTPYQNQLFPYDDKLSETFSPNRQVASAVQLGTLPAMAASGTPWRTLLFRPDVGGSHPGAQSPPDYMLLDLFWMPVIDPYPISEPLSTAGKVNLNYQIAPFTYIDRSTAILGALKSVKIPALPREHADRYKWTSYTVDVSKSRYPISYLYGVDARKTLLFFQERFTSSDPNRNVFKSPAEICSIPLAPENNASSPIATGHSENAPSTGVIGSVDVAGATTASNLRTRIEDFWAKNSLTGDNVREAPYNALFPRLTTQSNTFTVYVRVQTLQTTPATPAGQFSDARDQISGEYRGSYTIERFIDPENPNIPDFAASQNINKTIYPYYQFRIKGSKQFLP